MNAKVMVEVDWLRKISRRILEMRGVDKDCSDVVTDMLIEADLWGRNSHGTMRLVKWAPGIEEGTIAKRNEMRLIRRSGSIEWFEGNMTLGPVSAMTAIESCLIRAKESGVAICCVSGASHIGMLGYYAQKAALKGQIGIIMCNTEPAMAPYGGLDKVIGTNPIAVGIPSGGNLPIVLDMATTVHARGRVVEALEEGEELPAGWAEDALGKPTIDPAKALEGSLLPAGGIKGYALAIIVDILSGSLSGSSVGTDVLGSHDMSKASSRGDFYMTIDPDHTVGRSAFESSVMDLAGQIRSSRSKEGMSIMLPGDPEMDERQRRLEKGIPMVQSIVQKLETLASMQSK